SERDHRRAPQGRRPRAGRGDCRRQARRLEPARRLPRRRRGHHLRQGQIDSGESVPADWTWSDRDTPRCAAGRQRARYRRAGTGRCPPNSEQRPAGPQTADTGGEAPDARGENAQEAPEGGAGGGQMILTVTLNAAIDRTVAVPSFRQGHRHRAVEASTGAGGKGVNVARGLELPDPPVIATGLAGGPTGARLMERLAEESILTDFTWIAGESRTNLAVIDPTSGEQTEINERGPEVSSEELERFLKKLLYLARGARLCAIA